MHNKQNRCTEKLLRLLVAFAIGLPTVGLGAEIEEIVVVAQKREQSLADVSVSVTALSGEKLERLSMDQAFEIVHYVPNLNTRLSFGEGQQPALSIRGVGLFSFTDSFEPPVSMYVDDVYKGSGVGQSIMMFDLERVEILRGPQGTLFGRNSTGGLLHLISRKPTEEFEADISAAYGTDDEITLKAALGGPISDSMRGRLAIRRNTRDGWVQGADGHDYGDGDSLGVRGILEIDVGDKGTLALTATHSSFEGRTGALAVTGHLDPATGETCTLSELLTGNCFSPLGVAFSGVPFTGRSFGGFGPEHVPGITAASAGFGFEPEQDVAVRGYSARFDWDFDNWSLTVIGALEDTEKHYFEDLVVFSDGFSLDADQVTLELRAAGELDNGANWLVGTYYFGDEKNMGAWDPTPVFGFTTTGLQDTNSWAAFGQTTFPLSDSLSVTLGARYTDEGKDLDYSTDFGFTDSVQHDSSQVTGRVGLDWNVSDDTLTYLSYSTGFKSGGFNGQFVFTAEGLFPVDDEKLATWELGLKTKFWDKRASFNGALFFSQYDDRQLTVQIDTPGGTVATGLRNAGNNEIHGLEAELLLLATENLSLDLTFAWIETEILSNETISSGGYTTQIQGNEIENTPKFTYSILANYAIPMESNGRFLLQAGYSWKDDFWFSVENIDLESSDSYGLLNARLSWISPTEKLRVEIFGNNLTDQEYTHTLGNVLRSVSLLLWGRPRTYGVKLSYQLP